ncbi:hypothetical protein ACIPYR_12560 [Streptomyces parvus]|uniref:hypothetical protein n=1 Tax=Streptomyces parvus TaxID=66428 RepID=UPI003818923A
MPTLVADYPRDGDLHLGGRGLSLVPSFFCTERPATLIDPELPPVLVYPVSRRPASAAPLDGLPELLGRTRALALCAVLAVLDGRTGAPDRCVDRDGEQTRVGTAHHEAHHQYAPGR